MKTPKQSAEVGIDVQRLVRLIVARAEQACRYAVKHQDLSDSNQEYATGFRVFGKVCESAIAEHIARHLEEDISKANDQISTKKPMGNNLVEKWETLAASWLQVAREIDAPDIRDRARARAAIYQDCAEELKTNPTERPPR